MVYPDANVEQQQRANVAFVVCIPSHLCKNRLLKYLSSFSDWLQQECFQLPRNNMNLSVVANKFCIWLTIQCYYERKLKW